jgi:hypothetical protein
MLIRINNNLLPAVSLINKSECNEDIRAFHYHQNTIQQMQLLFH